MDFAAGVYLSEAPSSPVTPYLFTHCIRVYCILIHTGKVGIGRMNQMNQREGYRGNSSQSWVENTNMTDCIFSL
jgi:hypothetical protein